MVLPKALRSFAHLMELASAVRAPPTHAAPEFEAAHVQDVEGNRRTLANLAQNVLHRDLTVVENQRTGGRPTNPKLVLLGTDAETGEGALDDEGGELFAIYLGKDHEHVRERGVGDPHLLAVEQVVLAVGREHRLGAGIHGVRTRTALRKRIGANPVATGQQW